MIARGPAKWVSLRRKGRWKQMKINTYNPAITLWDSKLHPSDSEPGGNAIRVVPGSFGEGCDLLATEGNRMLDDVLEAEAEASDAWLDRIAKSAVFDRTDSTRTHSLRYFESARQSLSAS